MRSQLHSEALKARSGSMLLGCALAACLLDAISMLGTASRAGAGHPSAAQLTHDLAYLTVGSVLVSLVFGVLIVTNEYRHLTIGRTILLARRRDHVLAAKAIVAGAGGGAIAAAAIVSGLLVMHAAVRRITGEGAVLDRETVLIVCGIVIASALAAAWGTVVGWVVRHQAGALLLSLAWTLGVDNALLTLAPGLGRLLPGGAEAAIYRDPTPHLLSMPLGLVVYTTWLLAAAAGARALLQRRDVA